MTKYDDNIRLTEATQRFVQEMKRARHDGVDLSGIFLEVQDQVNLAWVRAVGLMLGICWIFACPVAVPLFKVYCQVNKLDVPINEWMYIWPCVVGLFSIMAFGYNLVDPRTLKRITGHTDVEPPTDHVITPTGTFLPFIDPNKLPPKSKILPPVDQGLDGDV